MFKASFSSIKLGCLIRNSLTYRTLIFELVNRSLKGSYQGTYLSSFWVFLEPLLMLVVYVVVLRYIFGRFWLDPSETVLQFSVFLLAGLTVFNLFREVIGEAPKLITGNENYVKKVVFPLEILPVVSVAAALVKFSIGFLILIILSLISGGQIGLEILFTPILILPYALFLLGSSYFLASLGVYFRDLGQLIGMVISATLFLGAIFYPISSIPEKLQHWFYLNPVALTAEQFRDISVAGVSPNFMMVAAYAVAGVVWLKFGFTWFQKTRRGFSDVL